MRHDRSEQWERLLTNLQTAVSRLEEYVRQRMRVENTPGLALAITDRERTLHIGTYGYADLATKSPVTEATLFEIGSIGKSFTAIALVQLAEAGLVDLHAPVKQYLPWFEAPSDFEPITLHHLLTHTAGITAGTDFSPEARFQVWALRELGAAGTPGDCFHYSNVGYKVLGLVLSEVLGQAYGDVIQERLLGPLGMSSSLPVITHDARSHLAVGYQSLYDDRPPYRGDPLVPAPWIETDTGDGSIASTPADMAAYARMWLNLGQGPTGPVLTADGFGVLTQHTSQLPTSGEFPFFADDFNVYAYGLNAELVGRHMWFWHGGGMIGYSAMLVVDRDDGVGALAMINGPGSPSRIARTALELAQAAIHGRPLPAPSVEDPTDTEDADDYAGRFVAGDKSIELVADGRRLLLRHGGGDQIILEPYWGGVFYVNHPDCSRFLLRFERDDQERVVAATHGADWYGRAGTSPPAASEYPSSWEAYPGHYRSHNPWSPNFRVVLRTGRLWLIFPLEPDGFDDEQPLVPLGDGLFQVGEGECKPERLRFDTRVGGRTLRAILSGGDYYRVFTP